MNETDIINIILVISLISLSFLLYFFRGKITSLSKRIDNAINTKISAINASNKNDFCIFLYWLKFFHFCTWFIFMLGGVVILFWMIFKNPILPVFFTNVTITTGLKAINEPSAVQSYFAGDFSALIILIGIFAGYCYFFDYIRSIGWKINKLSSENGKLSSSFMYLFFLCVFVAVVFIGGAIEGYYEIHDSNKIFELSVLGSILIIAILNIRFFKKIYPDRSLTFEQYTQIASFLKQTKFDAIFTTISILIFIISLEIAIIGNIFRFNPLTIISVDVFLLFTLWVFGILNQHSQSFSTIRLKNGRSISRVYILDTDNNFIHYLTGNDTTEKITISSVFKIEKSQESSIYEAHQTLNDCPYQHDKKCFYLSKISEGTILVACIVSIFIGILFMLINAFFPLIQIEELFNIGVFAISFLLLCVLVFLSIIIVFTYLEIKEDSSNSI